jgi:hypothetical protein
VQTRPGAKALDERDYTPSLALHEAINDLQQELTTLRAAFVSGVQAQVSGMPQNFTY